MMSLSALMGHLSRAGIMNNVIAAKFASIIAATQAGVDVVAAFEAEFGAGSYAELAGMIHADLRAQA